ncbi:rCG56056 [Rattus norvegicus]|uniref:RCG56056 n=1 Tax=Rattus norvegicus TaxID=10116 RepID=A6IAE6_RAT|nr:rCG56056 [Rattus norvegicus]
MVKLSVVIHLKKIDSLSHRSYQLSRAPEPGVGAPSRVLIGLVLYQVSVGNQSCSEFMSTAILLYSRKCCFTSVIHFLFPHSLSVPFSNSFPQTLNSLYRDHLWISVHVHIYVCTYIHADYTYFK